MECSLGRERKRERERERERERFCTERYFECSNEGKYGPEKFSGMLLENFIFCAVSVVNTID